MKKSLKKNFILQILYQTLTIITPLLTAPYIARVLGAANVGINSYSYAITCYFSMVAALGIENYGSRLIAQKKNNKEELDRAFSELFVVHFVIAVLVYMLFMGYCMLFVNDNKNIFLIQSFYVLGVVFDVNWLYFGLEEFQRTVTKNSILKIINVILIFLFVKDSSDLVLYVAILAIGTFINYSILWVGIKKFVSFKKVSIDKCLVHIKPLFILFLPSIAVMLYKYMDKIMLMNMADSSAVGFYDSGEKIITLCLGLINALGVVMLPRISSLKQLGNNEKVEEYFNKSIMLIGFISVGCCFGAFSVAKDFVPFFFGPGYEPSIVVMQGLALTMPFSAFANVAKTQYMLPNSKDNLFANTLICGALINFVINFLLIPKLNVMGATVGTICTEVFVCVVQLIASNKEMHTFNKILKILGFVAAGLAMSFVLGFLNIVDNIVLRVAIKVCVGAVLYISMSLIYFMFIDKKIIVDLFGGIKKKLFPRK